MAGVCAPGGLGVELTAWLGKAPGPGDRPLGATPAAINLQLAQASKLLKEVLGVLVVLSEHSAALLQLLLAHGKCLIPLAHGAQQVDQVVRVHHGGRVGLS